MLAFSGAALAGPKTSGGTYDAAPLTIPFLDTSRMPGQAMPAQAAPAAPRPAMPAIPAPPQPTAAPMPLPAYYPPAPALVMPGSTPAPNLAVPAAASAVTKPVTPLGTDYWKSYATTVVDLVTAPFTADSSTLIKTGLVLGAIAGASALDDNIKRYTQRHRNATSDKVSDAVRPFGEPALLAGGMVLAYAGGTFAGSPKLQETGLLALESLVITAGLTEGIKRVAGRGRPNQTDDQYKFDGPGGAGKSFPSGHASHAFAVASVLAEEYADTRIVPVLAYGVATLTALSRINDNKHWLSDVAFSAALGYAVGKLVVKNSPFREGNAVSVMPYSDGREIGLNLSAKF
jgi:hypothetical protein